MGSIIELTFRLPNCYKNFDTGYKLRLEAEKIKKHGAIELLNDNIIPKLPIIILEKSMSQYEFFERGFSEWTHPELEDYRQTLENTFIPEKIKKKTGTKKSVKVYEDNDDIIISYKLYIGA